MKAKQLLVLLVCIAIMFLPACSSAAPTPEAAAPVVSEQEKVAPESVEEESVPEKAAEEEKAPAEEEAPVAEEAPAEKTELLVYSGAGLKKAMEEVKTVFESDHDVVINYVYAGSAQLLSQIEASGKGDVFIVGSQAAYKTIFEKGEAEENQLVAHHTPVIAVPKGNPANITSLEDLTKPGVRVILGDPKANAIGLTAQKIFEKNNIVGVDANVVNLTATVNEIIVALKAGNCDVAIMTKDGASGNEADLDLIEIPAEQNIDQIIPVCVLKTTTDHDMAQAFVDFVASQDGKAIFEKHGFAPYNE